MANNLLATPSSWKDDQNHVPPSYWNGTLYAFSGDNTQTITATIVNTGDFVEFNLNNLQAVTGNPQELIVFQNGGIIHTDGLTATGTSNWNSGALTAGDVIQIEANGQNVPAYAFDFTLAPPAPPVAPNESITCAEYSSNNVLTPAITQSGSPVIGSTLAIASPAGNGTASVSGANLLYTPNDGYFGPDSFTYTATYNGLVSNTATVTVTVTPAACDEIGRTTKAVASAYYRTRIQDCRLMMGEKRCLVADFNGVISSARKIVSVVWKCDFGYVAQMSRARIQPDNRSAAVDILANWIGDSVLQCAATLDNGEVYMQMFRVDVSGDPIFMPAVSGNGPTVLTAT